MDVATDGLDGADASDGAQDMEGCSTSLGGTQNLSTTSLSQALPLRATSSHDSPPSPGGLKVRKCCPCNCAMCSVYPSLYPK
jgi:hypothetical protein